MVSTSSPDVFLIGGGPAGLACAIAAAQAGLSVELADAAKPSIEKACGEGLMPDSVQELQNLGVDLSDADKFPFRGIRFIKQQQSTEANFPHGMGYGVRRLQLHALLTARAQQAGVRFRWGCAVRSMENGTVTTAHHQVTPRWIIGADGHQSVVRKWAGLDAGSLRSTRIGLRQHYGIAPWSPFVEIYWGDAAQAYVTPISTHEVCVVFIATKKFASVDHALNNFPELKERLRGAPRTTVSRGAITLQRKLRRVTAGNIALVGDASGSVDAITGEGLALGFRHAIALVDALQQNDLTRYEVAHQRIGQLPHFMSQMLLLLDRHRFARTRTFNAFSGNPDLFGRMLNLHISNRPPQLLGSNGVLAMGLKLLTT